MTQNTTPELREMLANALLYVANRNPKYGATRLMKYIFLSDVIHYNLFGTLLFPGNYYIKFEHGPVSSVAYDLVQNKNEYLEVIPPQENYQVTMCLTKKDPDMSGFTESQEAILTYVALNIPPEASTISNLTHGISCWKNTSDRQGRIPTNWLKLTDSDKKLLRQINVMYYSFATEVAKNMDKLQHIAEEIDSVKSILDQMIVDFPNDELPSELYECYLAWDDVMRLSMETRHTEMIPSLCEKGMSMISVSLFPNCSSNDFCNLESYNNYFNDICRILEGDLPELKDPDDSVKKAVNTLMRNVKEELSSR